MKVKNTCGKIINFGTLTLLPGQVGVLPSGFENSPVIGAYVENDNITILKDTTAVEPSAEDFIPEDLAGLKKDELVAICEKLGIGVEDTYTKAALVEKIEGATAK